jgi:hypothetical protein
LLARTRDHPAGASWATGGASEHVTTTKRRAPRAVLEESLTGRAVIRVDEVLLSRDERGTWLIDMRVRSSPGDRWLQIPIGKHRAIDRLAWELRRSENQS